MHLIPEWAPNIHPLIVHFPIALLIFAVFFDLLALVYKKYQWLSTAALILYVIGSGTAILALLTGSDAAEGLNIPLAAKQAVSIHSDWAHDTVWFFSIFTVVRLYFFWEGEQNKNYFKYGVFALGLAGIFLLYKTGDHGAELVYKYGLGTPNVQAHKETTTPSGTHGHTPTMDSKGGWSWVTGPDADQVLKNDFQWITGSASDLNPKVVNDEHGQMLLELNASGKAALFVFPHKMGILQTNARFKLEHFKGEIAVVDHVEDAGNYDFLALKNGEVMQGRMENGKRNIREKNTVKANGWTTLTLDIAGHHHHGHLNGKEVTHTHIDLKKPAPAGLYIHGTGKILLRYYNAQIIPEDHDND
jgi:uncharacterized membrane protein